MKIYIGNLSYQLSEENLRELFAEYGEILSVQIIKDKNTGRSKGFGFVEMAAEEAAALAIKELHGKELNGRNILVDVARPKKITPRTEKSRAFD